MNRLTKTDSRRGRGVPGTRSPSVRGPVTSAPAAGASATRNLPVGSHAPSSSASPFGGSWPTSSPREGLYPPGGFTNYLHSNPFAIHPNGNIIPENFHFVGAMNSPMSPIDMGDKRAPSPEHNDAVDDDVDAQGTEMNNGHEDLRTDKCLNWSVDEDLRLASAWLRNSKDPVEGIVRKADKYWEDVTEEYNKTAWKMMELVTDGHGVLFAW